MDTKSKSRHSLGIIIIMIAVLLTSAATVGLYPYLVERAFEYKERYEAQRKDNYINNVSNDLALQMMNSCYQAWREQVQEEEGRLLTLPRYSCRSWKESCGRRRRSRTYSRTPTEMKRPWWRGIPSTMRVFTLH